MKYGRFATLITLFLAEIIPLSADAFTVHTMNDLTGDWEVNALESPGPWWSRGLITIAGSGMFSGTSNGSDSSATPISGTFVISDDGIITATSSVLTPSIRCTLDNNNRIAACTGTTSENESELYLLVKKSTGYEQTSLMGTWEVNSIVSGPGAPWWSRGPVTIGPSGSFSGTLEFSDDVPENVSGSFILSPDGVITSTAVNPGFRAVLDSGRSVVAGTSTWSSGAPGSTELSVWTKKATTSYSLSDLAGAWQVNELGAPGPSWTRGVMTIAANGAFSGTLNKSNGGTESRSGTVSITPDGVITVSSPDSPASTRCTMDAGKDVIVCTYINSSNEARLSILTSYSWTFLPTITTFSLPATSSSVTVPVSIAVDNPIGISGYYLSEISSTPSAGDAGWSGSLPTFFTFSGKGPHNLYAWVKDFSNNISLRSDASVNILCLLTVTKSGSGGGDINCDIGNLIWSGSTGSAAYDLGASVKLSATPNSLSTFSGWSGGCTPSDLSNCTASMADDRNVTATFTAAPKAMIGQTGYPTLNAAYSAAPTQGTTIIRTLDAELVEGLAMNSGKNIVLIGGYNSSYSGRTGIPTRLKGILTVGTGKLTVNGLVVK